VSATTIVRDEKMTTKTRRQTLDLDICAALCGVTGDATEGGTVKGSMKGENKNSA
jgi:hypothetical protein